MKKSLTPQQQKLIDLHQTGEWVCSTEIEYMRDHRKRYSELTSKGYVFEAEPCDGKNFCGVLHSSKVFMRRLKNKPVVLKQKVTFRETPTGRVAVIDLVPTTV